MPQMLSCCYGGDRFGITGPEKPVFFGVIPENKDYGFELIEQTTKQKSWPHPQNEFSMASKEFLTFT